AADDSRSGDGHAGLHVTGAATGQGAGRTHRSVFFRCGAVRDGYRIATGGFGTAGRGDRSRSGTRVGEVPGAGSRSTVSISGGATGRLTKLAASERGCNCGAEFTSELEAACGYAGGAPDSWIWCVLVCASGLNGHRLDKAHSQGHDC